MSGNQSLERGINILGLLDSSSAGLGVREIARTLELSPTIVQRLINTLSAAGFVTQAHDSKRYQLGYRAIVLGSAMRREDRLLSSVSRELTELAEQHHLNGYLGVLRDGQAIYLDSIQSSGPISVRVLPGSRINIHSTAIGKMLLAPCTDDEVRQILGPDPLRRYTSKTRTTVAKVLADLVVVRQQDYAAIRDENIEGVSSVAASIHDTEGKPVAAISVAFMSSERGAHEIADVVNLIRDAAYRCSQSIGYPGMPPTAITDSTA